MLTLAPGAIPLPHRSSATTPFRDAITHVSLRYSCDKHQAATHPHELVRFQTGTSNFTCRLPMSERKRCWD